MRDPIWFRWLGVAGIELQVRDEILIIDPCLTRPAMQQAWFGRVHPDRELIAQKIQRCDYVLVTHAHYDHVMDVPDVVRNTGAVALGSPNTCRLLTACGVPKDQMREIGSRDKVRLGSFCVETLSAEHMKIPGFGPGPLPDKLQPPLRLRDYRMDTCLSFLIQVDDLRLLDWSSIGPEPAPAADVLFVRLYEKQATYQALLEDTQPRLVIPVHWDDLFRPASKPTRPWLKPPSCTFPPLQRMDPARFKGIIEGMKPGVDVLIPEIFRVYRIQPGVETRHSPEDLAR